MNHYSFIATESSSAIETKKCVIAYLNISTKAFSFFFFCENILICFF